jgi:hypothetical protein
MDFGAYSTVVFVASIIVGILSLWLLILAIVVGHRYLSVNPGRPVGMSPEEWIRVRMLANGVTFEKTPDKGSGSD